MDSVARVLGVENKDTDRAAIAEALGLKSSNIEDGDRGEIAKALGLTSLKTENKDTDRTAIAEALGLGSNAKNDQFAFADVEDDPWYKTVWGFAKDLGNTPRDFLQGADDTILGQQRLLFNYLQGDDEEMGAILEKLRKSKPIEANTTVGGWVRQAAESAPFLVENVLAGVGGGAVGSIAGPAGATAGGIAAAAATSYLQGWGEIFQSLMENDVDKDTAATIAFAAAIPYAGLDFAKMGPILKRLGVQNALAKVTMPQVLKMIKADKVLGAKVTKALGNGFLETFEESAIEGLQGGTINAAEQWARGDWDTSEFLNSVKEDAVGSLGSMAVTIGTATAIGGARRRRAERKLREKLDKELEIEEPDTDLVKRSWDNEVGTPFGVTEEMPKTYQEKVAWATQFTPEARGEIVEEAKRRALKDMGKPESELTSEEKRQAGSLANDYAVQMLKEAHDFKLRLADLDADKYAFEKVFAEDLQNIPYAQNLNDDANLEEDFSSQVDENARYNRNDTVWNDTPFDRQIDSYNEGTYQSGKLFTVGTPSELLKSKGIPEKKILMTEGVLKKIRKHGLSDGQIKKIPNAINNPIGIFSYPKNKNVFDILVEFHTDDGKPIIVSLEVNKNRQGFGEITDLLTAHPKESFGRIIDWAKKGRCIYWDKQKGRKLLQDTSPANRERYETELAPFLPSQSENFSENQEENAKYSKNFDENAENADLSGDLPQGKGEPLVFKPILKPKLPLPKRFREGKVAGIGDIRRWVSEAMGINVNLEADAGADYNGVYTTPSDTIHLRSDNINSLRVLFHELGHSIEKRFFNDYFSDNPNSEAGRELFDYFKKQANAKAYKKSDYVGEGFAEFIKEFVLNPGLAAKEFPKTAKLFSAALENHAGLNEILDKTRQMVDRYQHASSKEKAQARMQSSDKEKAKVFLRERPLKIYNWLTRHFTDKSARLADLQRIVNKLAGEGTADFDTLRRAIVQGGGNGQTEFSLTQKQLDLKGRIVGKSYADILNPVESRLDDFRLFVVSRRMVNLMQKNGYLKDGKYRAGANDFCVEKSGFTLNEIQEFYKSADMKFRTASVLLDKFQQNNLQLLVDGGLISQESAKEMGKNFGYVPFRRLMEFSNSEAGLSSNSNSMPVREMRGSQREIIDPLETIMENAYIFRTLAAKNLVKLGLCKSVSRLGGSGRILEKDVRTKKATVGSKWDFANAVVNSGLAEDVLASDGLNLDEYYRLPRQAKIEYIMERVSEKNPFFKFILWKDAVSPDPKNRVITTFNKGRLEAWKINDEGVYDALSSLDETTGRLASSFFESIARLSKGVNSVTRTGATANLAFGAKNFVRDQFTAGVFSKSESGFIPFVSTIMRGVVPAIVKDKNLVWREWVASGGYNASFVGGSKALSLEALAKKDPRWQDKVYRKDHPIWGTVTAVGKAAIHPLQTLSEIFENATRIAEFALLREEYIKTHGKAAWEKNFVARMEAANSSKDITVNFSESGKTGKRLNNTVWYFFNARMQGLRKTFGGYLPIDVPIALRYLAGDKSFKASHMYNEDGMVHLIRAVSQTAILLMLKAAYGADDDDIPEWKRETCWNFKFGNTIISIPKDYEGLPIYEAVERILGADRDKAYWNFLLTSQLDFQLIPSALNPVVEHIANYSFFRGKPLVSDFLRDTPDRLKKYPSTSQAMQALSRGLSRVGVDVSPIILEHYLTGYTAGLGKEALWWIDKIGGDVGIWNKKIATYADSPINILNAFKQNPFGSGGAVDSFYDMRSDMRKVMSMHRKIEKGELSPSEMNARERREFVWYEARKWQINQIDKELSDYNNAIRRTMQSENLAVPAKIESIKEFVKKRNSLAKLAKRLKYSEEAYEKWRADVLGD